MLIPHGATVLAVDGGRMRLMRNRGREQSIELEMISSRDLDNPRTHVLSEPQPGRRFESSGSMRSAYSSTDTHQLREDVFCREALDEALTEVGDDGELILIAPAHVIGVLRKHREHDHKLPTIHEIIKDLAVLTPHELSQRLRDHR